MDNTRRFGTTFEGALYDVCVVENGVSQLQLQNEEYVIEYDKYYFKRCKDKYTIDKKNFFGGGLIV